MTVRGPIEARALGITLPHEHLYADLFRVTRDGDHLLTEIPLIVEEARRFRAAGGSTIVELTNLSFGRDPWALRTISEQSGLHVIMGCGWYREPYYEPRLYEQSTNALAAEIVRDLTAGVDGSGIRAGIIGEIGCDRAYISPAEERSFRAAARAHRQTGVTISTHADYSRVGLAQLDLLEEEGVDPRRVIVGHCDSHPDPDYHAALARRGAYVQLDNVRGEREWNTRARIACVLALVGAGYLRQILLSQDVCMRHHLRALGGTGYDYVVTEFAAALRGAGLSREQVEVLLVENPRAALSGEDG